MDLIIKYFLTSIADRRGQDHAQYLMRPSRSRSETFEEALRDYKEGSYVAFFFRFFVPLYRVILFCLWFLFTFLVFFLSFLFVSQTLILIRPFS
jgi:hypothetical protein